MSWHLMLVAVLPEMTNATGLPVAAAAGVVSANAPACTIRFAATLPQG